MTAFQDGYDSSVKNGSGSLAEGLFYPLFSEEYHRGAEAGIREHDRREHAEGLVREMQAASQANTCCGGSSLQGSYDSGDYSSSYESPQAINYEDPPAPHSGLSDVLFVVGMIVLVGFLLFLYEILPPLTLPSSAPQEVVAPPPEMVSKECNSPTVSAPIERSSPSPSVRSHVSNPQQAFTPSSRGTPLQKTHFQTGESPVILRAENKEVVVLVPGSNLRNTSLGLRKGLIKVVLPNGRVVRIQGYRERPFYLSVRGELNRRGR